MSHVNNHTQANHGTQQLFPHGIQMTGRFRTVGIPSGAVMFRANRPQAISIRPFHMIHRDELVGALDT